MQVSMDGIRSSEDYFEVVGELARRLGRCPVTMLDDFFANHWDIFQLCDAFGGRCESSGGVPEDCVVEWYFADEGPEEDGDVDSEIPF